MRASGTCVADQARAPREAARTVLRLPGVASSAAAARRFTAEMLADCPRLEDLVLAVSELATNAVRWSVSGSGGTFTVRIRAVRRWARIEVTDQGPAPLAGIPASDGGLDESGRGLAIVAAVTDRHGVSEARDGSVTAWAEVTWPDQLS